MIQYFYPTKMAQESLGIRTRPKLEYKNKTTEYKTLMGDNLNWEENTSNWTQINNRTK